MSAYFDAPIAAALEALAGASVRRFSPEVLTPWPVAERAPFLLERDTALELGRPPDESVNLFGATQSAALLPHSEVWVAGDELNELPGPRAAYGRLLLVRTAKLDEADPYSQLKDLELHALSLHLQGVMVRASAEQNRENLRVGTDALRDGLRLAALGAALARHYLAHPLVIAVRVVLLCGAAVPYARLAAPAEEIRRTLAAMNTMLSGLELDCGACALSPVCDEVEGLRALHQKMR